MVRAEASKTGALELLKAQGPKKRSKAAYDELIKAVAATAVISHYPPQQ